MTGPPSPMPHPAPPKQLVQFGIVASYEESPRYAEHVTATMICIKRCEPRRPSAASRLAAPPQSVLDVTADEEAAIREAVRTADPATLGPGRVLATEAHAEATFDLLADPAVSEPIYALPKPLTLASVKGWIEECEIARRRGECLLILNVYGGHVMGYSKVTIWPDRSAADLGGAIRANLQSAGAGGAGATHTIGWIFKTLKVRLICLTAATDNVRSAKLIDRMGFKRMGERDATRPDGTIRRSIYWELQAHEWAALTGR